MLPIITIPKNTPLYRSADKVEDFSGNWFSLKESETHGYGKITGEFVKEVPRLLSGGDEPLILGPLDIRCPEFDEYGRQMKSFFETYNQVILPTGGIRTSKKNQPKTRKRS